MTDLDNLLSALEIIRKAPLTDLQDTSYLTVVIGRAGLFPDSRDLYGDDKCYQNEIEGAWQIPVQLAGLIASLTRCRINTYLDVGVFNGWTCSLITAVLHRFNESLVVTAIDSQKWWNNYSIISKLLPVGYHPFKISRGFRKLEYDFVFIDADHEYSKVFYDYYNVGRKAGLCALHDCNDAYIKTCPVQNGGVPRLWGEIKGRARTVEFFDHPNNSEVMGIGLVIGDRYACDRHNP